MAQKPRELDPARSPASAFGANLRAHRVAGGMSQADLAAHVQYTPAAVGTWEKGRSLPERSATVQALDDLFGAHGTLMNSWRLAAAISTPADLIITPESVIDTLCAGAMTAAVLHDWEQTVARYAVASKDRAPSELIPDLRYDIADLNRLLEHRRPVTVSRHLTRTLAQLCGLLTLAHVKDDNRPAFRSWARTARIAACEVGDAELEAWVTVQEAYGHFYSDDFHTALATSQQAWDRTRSVPRVAAVLAAALEGRAHAALGDQTESDAAFGRAEDALAGLPAAETELSALGYTPSALGFHRCDAQLRLGNTRQAWADHAAALPLFEAPDYVDRTLTLLGGAECLAREGDPIGAADYAGAALDELTRPQLAGIISMRAHDVIKALPRPQQAVPAVVALRDRLLSYNDDDGGP